MGGGEDGHADGSIADFLVEVNAFGVGEFGVAREDSVECVLDRLGGKSLDVARVGNIARRCSCADSS